MASRPMSQPDSHSTLRFGEFELDISAYELRRGGQPVHLERQPMDLLILLVERHRQLVWRADIAKRLWDPGVFVDVEMGVNTAIRKVRQALRDSQESPAFIETISGKGYRFIAPVDAASLGRQQEAIESGAVLPFANDSADPGWGILVRRHHRNPDQQSLANLELARGGAQHGVPLQRKGHRPPKGRE